MEPKAIKLNYRSAQRFSRDYALLKSGRIFLPSKTLLPIKTALTLNFTVPGIDNVFTIEGVVEKTVDEQAAALLKKPTGMVLAVVGEPDAILNKLNAVLCTHINYQILLGLMPPAEPAPPSSNQETTEEKLAMDRTARKHPPNPTHLLSIRTRFHIKPIAN
jgi:hypothetical protein